MGYRLLPIQETIWDAKYRLKAQDGTPIDVTIEDTWNRVAAAISAVEIGTDQSKWFNKFYDAMHGFKFLPAGRIYAGAGTNRNVTLSNCFTMGTINDDLPGIFDALREAAITLKSGGGIGYDFSTIRYKGAPVLGVGADASGPLSFMECWNTMCQTMMGAGVRRGAMMGVLRVDHPDIEEFITYKQQAGRLTNFNVSVAITDDFMSNVRGGGIWHLMWNGKIIKSVDARELWDKIMRATYEYAEPGVIFIDRANALNNLNYCETIATSNPCGEKVMGPYASCVLGSLNLAALVENPFTVNAGIPLEVLGDLVATAVRFLDNVIDVSKYPLPKQTETSLAQRQIGLGITGLADTLAMCGLEYGSSAALNLQKSLQEFIMEKAYLASSLLAKERGKFPLWRESGFNRHYVNMLSSDTRKSIGVYGLRNGNILSIAPTGTISLLAGNISSGIEPIFSLRTERKRLLNDGTHAIDVVEDYAYVKFKEYEESASYKPSDDPTPIFATAQDLSATAHLHTLAIAQEYTDSAVSKTINLPTSISFKDFKSVYLNAYDLGCKGCTTYRPSGVRGAVLMSLDEVKPESVVQPEDTRISVLEARIRVLEGQAPQLPIRPRVLKGETHKLKWPNEDSALYFTVNTSEDGKPFEVFLTSKNASHYPWWSALTRMISAIYRRGGDTSFVANELLEVFDPKGGAFFDQKYIPSLPALLGHTLKSYFVDLDKDDGNDPAPLVEQPVAVPAGSTCPKCYAPSLTRQEGCETCLNCGYSKCG